MQEHEHIDREIGDFVYLLDVAAAENVSYFDAVIGLLQYVVHGIMTVIILAGLDLDGQYLSAYLDHKIQLSELLAVVIIECKCFSIVFLSDPAGEHTSNTIMISDPSSH